MIDFEEALGIVLQSAVETGTETVPFYDALGRVLGEDIVSDVDMPPFNRSAMDGYACHKNDLNAELDVVEVIPAGKVPLIPVGENQCSKIMTGAIVPEGCDIVFMVEESEILNNGKVRFTGSEPKRNISLRGTDIKKDDIILKRSRLILPQDIALLAAAGHTKVTVKSKPVVGILSTGDELVEPSVIPGISQIRNSNAYQLRAQVYRTGGEAIDYGIVKDDEIVTFNVLQKAIKQCDLVIITGGVSMGDFDFVPSVMERAGVKIMFDQVNVQPGKPTTFGVHPDAIVFGLPGNPVSSFIQFELLVKPLIYRMMSYDWSPREYKLAMGISFERKSTVRLGFIPVRISADMEIFPVDFHGSAHIAALSLADAVISIKPGQNILKKGEIVNVRQI